MLATATGALTRLRPAPRGLHPVGELRTARLVRHGSGVRTGSDLLDGVGTDDALVRLSRAVGVPASWPDVQGLALRVGDDAQGYDVLLASTGWHGAARLVLTFGRGPGSRPMTTLLPYRSAVGPILLGARFSADAVVELSWSRGLGAWHPFATLELGEPMPDEVVSFDAVLRPPPGLGQYAWVRALREPAYRDARRARSAA